MNTLQLLKASKKDQWKSRVSWLLYTLLGLFAPLVIGVIIQLILSRFDYSFFLSHGEVSIYAASLLVSVLYALDKAKVSAGSAKVVVYGLIVIVSALYATIVFRDRFATDSVFNDKLFQYLSLAVFIFALIAAYVTSVVSDSKDALEMEANVQRMIESRERSAADLEAKFDSIPDKGESDA